MTEDIFIYFQSQKKIILFLIIKYDSSNRFFLWMAFI